MTAITLTGHDVSRRLGPRRSLAPLPMAGRAPAHNDASGRSGPFLPRTNALAGELYQLSGRYG